MKAIFFLLLIIVVFAYFTFLAGGVPLGDQNFKEAYEEHSYTDEQQFMDVFLILVVLGVAYFVVRFGLKLVVMVFRLEFWIAVGIALLLFALVGGINAALH